MYVVPAEGLAVPDPVLRDHLPPNGRNVETSEHWTRRMLDGDVSNSPDAIGAALQRIVADRDAAKAARDAARATLAGMKADGDPDARRSAEEALAGAETALSAAEASVADITPHAPRPSAAHPRRAPGASQE